MLEVIRLYRFVSKLQLQAPGLVKQRSYFHLRRLLASLEPFVETAGFAVLLSFCVFFVEEFVFGKSSALRPTPLAGGTERSLFSGGLPAEFPLFKRALLLARSF
jgi:hypothetical protein